MKRNWSIRDVIPLVLEALSPFITIWITYRLPQAKNWTQDEKIAIISAGMVIPILILQFSLKLFQKDSNDNVENLGNTIEELDKKMVHFNPILEKAYNTENDRIIRFAHRRMDEANSTIMNAINLNNSGMLRSAEYYNELHYLADMICQDQNETGNDFKGEIWAMTSYEEDEWTADQGYENTWTDRLEELSSLGIKTRRLCIVPDEVYKLICNVNFKPPTVGLNKSFDGLISHLSMYYGSNASDTEDTHYMIREGDDQELTRRKGFFAIRLTNGDLHILSDETVDENGSITAKILFDQSEIEEIKRKFERYTKPKKILNKQINEVGSEKFKRYLEMQGINL